MKYTREDVIFWPDDERLEGAIGKECWYGNNPNLVLEKANDNDSLTSYLKKIYCGFHGTFEVSNNLCSWNCIIFKKEPKKKIVPFDLSLQEDKDAIKDRWLRSIRFGHELRIIEISDSTVWLGSGSSGYSAEELLSNYVFADTGKPVGKEVVE